MYSLAPPRLGRVNAMPVTPSVAFLGKGVSLYRAMAGLGHTPGIGPCVCLLSAGPQACAATFWHNQSISQDNASGCFELRNF